MEATNDACKRIEESLDAFHDGELSAAEQKIVEEHLASCAGCVGRLAEINRLVHSLRTLAPVQAPAGLSNRLDNLIDKQTKVVAFPRKIWMPMAAAAAVVAIVFGLRSGIPGTAPDAPVVAHEQPSVKQSGGTDNERVAAVPTTTTPIRKDKVLNLTADQVLGSTPTNLKVTQLNADNSNAKSGSGAPVTAVKNNAAPQQKIAAVPRNQPTDSHQTVAIASATSASLNSNFDTENDTAELAELPNTSNSFADAVGIAMDEDGLYDIKM